MMETIFPRAGEIDNIQSLFAVYMLMCMAVYVESYVDSKTCL